MQRWYALRSKPRKENVLWKQVEARGIDVFYPRVMARRPRSELCLIKPYFPGYMFVRTDIEAVGISTFRWMPYSVGLVSFDGEPAYVPDSLINAIRRHLTEHDQLLENKPPKFYKGEKVRIDDGPFEGYTAIFDRHIRGQERVKVLLELISGMHIALELSQSQLVNTTRIQ